MKYFKFLNLKRQHVGPTVVPEPGWKLLQANKDLKLLGECDAAGNLLTELSKNNFISAKVEPAVSIPEVRKPNTDPLDEWEQEQESQSKKDINDGSKSIGPADTEQATQEGKRKPGRQPGSKNKVAGAGKE